MDLYSSYMVPHTIPEGIIIFQAVLTKFSFLMKFPNLETNCQFNERPQIWAPKFISLWGRVKLNLMTGKENQIFILRTPATIKFFHQILKNLHFGVEKKIITHSDGFAWPIYVYGVGGGGLVGGGWGD